jgi:hypothetical protein
VARLEQHRLEGRLMQSAIEPLRQRPGLQADAGDRHAKVAKATSTSGSLATFARRMTLQVASSTRRLLSASETSIPTWCAVTALMTEGPEPSALCHHSGRDAPGRQHAAGQLRHLPDPQPHVFGAGGKRRADASQKAFVNQIPPSLTSRKGSNAELAETEAQNEP